MKTIVLGLDDSPAAKAALQWTAWEASMQGASVIVIHALSPVGVWVLSALQIDTDRIRRERVRELLGPWTRPLRARGVPYEARLLMARPGPALLRVARSSHASCIVLGADHHRRLGHASGPVQRFVEHHAQRPVVSVPPETEIMQKAAGPIARPPGRRNTRLLPAVAGAAPTSETPS